MLHRQICDHYHCTSLKNEEKTDHFLVQSSFESVVVVVKVLFDLNLILYAKIESALNP